MNILRFILHAAPSKQGIILLIAMLGIAPLASAGSNCVSYSETLETSGPTLAGPLSGIATVSIDNGVAQQALFTTILLGSVRDQGNGMIEARFADLYLFPDGQILTAISRTFLDLAAGTFTAKTRFTGGTGVYATVRGRAKLQGTGVIMPDGSVATNSMTEGKICFPGMPQDSDDSDSDSDADSDSNSDSDD